MKIGVLVFAFFICVLYVSFASASLGITPSKKEFQYFPGEDHSITYTIFTDDPSKVLTLHAEGDLAQYVTFDREELVGSGSFTITMDLPDKINTPGEHRIFVGANEKPREDQFLGTAINIRAVIIVFVPYPGRYADVQLNVQNGNVGDDIPMEARVINRGKETIVVDPKMDFYASDGTLKDTFTFTPVTLESGAEQYFRRYLNATNYLPGTYLSELTVDYGEITKVNQTFQIGSLFVNVTNFTESINGKGPQKFYVNIRSLWNNKVPEVYADVNLSNASFSTSFRTPSVDLNAWEQKQIVGFVDINNMAGIYKSDIVLRYLGQTTMVSGVLVVSEATNYLMIGLIIGGVVVALIALIVVVVIFLRKRKKK